MSPMEWAGFAVSVVTLATAAFVALRWVIRNEVHMIKHELTNNGGSSMKDKVDQNTERLLRLETRVDDIYLLLCEKDK